MSEVREYRRPRYDREYATQFKREMEYLSAKNIRPTYVWNNNGLITWKYVRTAATMQAIADFYKQYENERTLAKVEQEAETGTDMKIEDLQNLIPKGATPLSSAHLFGIFGRDHA